MLKLSVNPLWGVLRRWRGPVFEYLPDVTARAMAADFDTSPRRPFDGEVCIVFSGPKSEWATVYDVDGNQFSGPSPVATREALRLARLQKRHAVLTMLPDTKSWDSSWGRLSTEDS